MNSEEKERTEKYIDDIVSIMDKGCEDRIKIWKDYGESGWRYCRRWWAVAILTTVYSVVITTLYILK